VAIAEMDDKPDMVGRMDAFAGIIDSSHCAAIAVDLVGGSYISPSSSVASFGSADFVYA
jgi:hypothetical protein